MKTLTTGQILLLLIFLCCTLISTAQEVVVSNNMCIHNGANVGVFDHITNQSDTLFNNGHLILSNSSLNNQVPLTGKGTLEVVGHDTQDLFGGADIKIDSLWLNNSASEGIGFDANIFVAKNANFIKGLLVDFDLEDYVDPRELFYVQFGQDATVFNVRNASHIEGTVKKVGTNPFLYPIGDRGYYRPIYTNGSEKSESYTAKYFCCPNPFPEENVPQNVDILREEYWFVEGSKQEFTFDISYGFLTSKWDQEDLKDQISVAQYDGLFQNTDKVYITSTEVDLQLPTNKFTFYKTDVDNHDSEQANGEATVWYNFAKSTLLDGEFPQLVTPNDDNRNDVFDVPEKYLNENNRIEIFNRYGNTVFKIDQYDNTWDGKPNQPSFGGTDGYLPSGTYYVFFYVDDKLIYKDFLQLVHSK